MYIYNQNKLITNKLTYSQPTPAFTHNNFITNKLTQE